MPELDYETALQRVIDALCDHADTTDEDFLWWDGDQPMVHFRSLVPIALQALGYTAPRVLNLVPIIDDDPDSEEEH